MHNWHQLRARSGRRQLPVRGGPPPRLNVPFILCFFFSFSRPISSQYHLPSVGLIPNHQLTVSRPQSLYPLSTLRPAVKATCWSNVSKRNPKKKSPNRPLSHARPYFTCDPVPPAPAVTFSEMSGASKPRRSPVFFKFNLTSTIFPYLPTPTPSSSPPPPGSLSTSSSPFLQR